MLSHLLFVYNSTPHRVTGYSPYRLMFGREPSIPVDQLLNRTRQEWDQDFVQEQAEALQRSDEVVKRNLEAAANSNKRRHDQRPSAKDIGVGERVLLRQMAFGGRHKLADKYHRDRYIVVGVNPEKDVYQIRPLHGGEVRSVNRKLLLADPRQEEVMSDPPEFWPKPSDSDNLNELDDDIGGDEGEDPFIIFPLPEEVQVTRPLPGGIQPRRSSRSTKGTHSNPNRLPQSAMKSGHYQA